MAIGSAIAQTISAATGISDSEADTGLLGQAPGVGDAAATSSTSGMLFSVGQANGVGLMFGQTPHEVLVYGLADGVGDAYSVNFPKQIISLYGRRSGMMLQGSASRRV